MEVEVANGSDSFNRADLDFHASIWAASHNDLLQICGQAVSGSILKLMDDRMDRASDKSRAMQDSLERDRAIFAAIAEGNSAAAGDSARNAIASYFEQYLNEDGARGLQALGAVIDPQ